MTGMQPRRSDRHELGCNYYKILPTNDNLAYEGALSALLLIVALLLKQSERLARCWQIAYAFFVASAVWFLQTLVGGSGNWLARLLGLPVATPMGTAAVILVLIKVAGMDLGSVYPRCTCHRQPSRCS